MILVVPRWGVAIHSVLLTLSMGMDQTRLQAQIVSCAILLWASLPGAGYRAVGVAHLVALWFFAGLHKLLSVDHYAGSGLVGDGLRAFFYGNQVSPSGLIVFLSIAGAVLEIALAVCVLFLRTRRIGYLLVVLLHFVVLAVLVRAEFNSSVWARYVAVVCSAFVLFWGNRQPITQFGRQVPAWAWMVAAFLLVSPIGFYFERMDAYLAHCLYSTDKPRGILIRPNEPGGTSGTPTLLNEVAKFTLNVAILPVHRLFEMYVRVSETTQTGDLLYIEDCRPGATLRGRDKRLFRLHKSR